MGPGGFWPSVIVPVIFIEPVADILLAPPRASMARATISSTVWALPAAAKKRHKAALILTRMSFEV